MDVEGGEKRGSELAAEQEVSYSREVAEVTPHDSHTTLKVMLSFIATCCVHNI